MQDYHIYTMHDKIMSKIGPTAAADGGTDAIKYFRVARPLYFYRAFIACSISDKRPVEKNSGLATQTSYKTGIVG